MSSSLLKKYTTLSKTFALSLPLLSFPGLLFGTHRDFVICPPTLAIFVNKAEPSAENITLKRTYLLSGVLSNGTTCPTSDLSTLDDPISCQYNSLKGTRIRLYLIFKP
jgi:hypothetical protein